MNEYKVDLTYPRSSKQPVYSENVEAQTQAEALLIVTARARNAGWKGTPVKQVARIVRAVAA
jgi:hypothetical protein